MDVAPGQCGEVPEASSVEEVTCVLHTWYSFATPTFTSSVGHWADNSPSTVSL